MGARGLFDPSSRHDGASLRRDLEEGRGAEGPTAEGRRRAWPRPGCRGNSCPRSFPVAVGVSSLLRSVRNRSKLGAAGLVASSGFGIAACTSTPTHHPKQTTTTTTTTTLPSGGSTTTTTTAVPTSCSTGVLGLSTAAGGIAAGTAYSVFTLDNRGPSACSLDGYPNLVFFGPSGAGGSGAGPKLSIGLVDAGPAPRPVTLKSGGSAEFILVYHDVPVGGVGCETVGSVDVSLPSSSEVLSALLSISACGGTTNVYAFGLPGSERP